MVYNMLYNMLHDMFERFTPGFSNSILLQKNFTYVYADWDLYFAILAGSYRHTKHLP